MEGSYRRCKCCLKQLSNDGVVAGGGAAELHAIEKIKSLRLKGLEQVGLEVVISALESIMRQILTNAGFNGLEKIMAAKALLMVLVLILIPVKR